MTVRTLKPKKKRKKQKARYCKECPLYIDGGEPTGKQRIFAMQLCKKLKTEEECAKFREKGARQ